MSLTPGLYNVSGTLICTWGNSGIDVGANYTASDYNTFTTSPYYVLTNKYPTITKVVLPDDTPSIGDYAFYGCTNLTEVTMHKGVTSIGDSAFGGCTSLSMVSYIGTKEHWEAINIGSGNDALINATKVFNYVVKPLLVGENGEIVEIPITSTITYAYTVTAPNGGTIHVDESVDGVIFNSFDTTSGSEHTLTLDVNNLPVS